MYINPSNSVHPVFSSWLERRRDRVRAQHRAIDEERFDDLVDLITDEGDDRPPAPSNEQEREQYEQMLAESRELTTRLLRVRGELLKELRNVERRQMRGPIRESRSGRGGSLDGYL